MKLLLLLAVVVPLVFCAIPRKMLDDPEVDMWKAWKVKYEKRYETASEENSRFKIWRDNVQMVRKTIKESKSKFFHNQIKLFLCLDKIT